ncbi:MULTISPECIES: MEDS domain-containing protein [unclassified Micromonospora]|uniref:MEDS domain-containing protein n=1 Tax=unclassified Micromonospora TaxID=2617518 RepID=UPI0022B65097|nr:MULTISPECIES: MEDS domain-containing protein [unclassified Micromonospora]MCZ7421274.1 MEDS domain-containing protein [Verrucosispora sp. WMMA2121]WBB94032.1 MEDS domain-containing protein [Verrucosispora sp. WMMC514]
MSERSAVLTDQPPRYRHLCWAYDDPAGFMTHAVEFLRDGLAAGERVWFVVSGPAEPVRDQLLGTRDFADALLTGAAQVRSLDGAYGRTATIDPASQVAAYRSATREAVADGYTGLRVAADATELVRTPAQRDAFARYEHRVNEMMRTEAFRAMCAYDRSRLGESAVAELACLHPEHNLGQLLFRLYAVPLSQGQTALAGELDPSNHDLFRTALDRADLRPVEDELVLDAHGLRFLDHRALIHLSEYARDRHATVVLRAARPGVARLAALLDLPDVRVEVAR